MSGFPRTGEMICRAPATNPSGTEQEPAELINDKVHRSTIPYCEAKSEDLY